MIEALAEYLESLGYDNVYCDYLPDVSQQRDCIYLGKWDHTLPLINDGTGVQYIQIQVRRKDYTTANADCNAIFKLLDSGLEEKVLHLTDTHWCIARPRRGPLLLDRGTNYTTFYFELALWGEN